jgi:hypothetical protein
MGEVQDSLRFLLDCRAEASQRTLVADGLLKTRFETRSSRGSDALLRGTTALIAGVSKLLNAKRHCSRSPLARGLNVTNPQFFPLVLIVFAPLASVRMQFVQSRSLQTQTLVKTVIGLGKLFQMR